MTTTTATATRDDKRTRTRTPTRMRTPTPTPTPTPTLTTEPEQTQEEHTHESNQERIEEQCMSNTCTGADGDGNGANAGAGASASASANWLDKIKAPPFLKKLRQVTETVPRHVASWNDEGNEFTVFSRDFDDYLARTYKGTSLTFVRQLHFYGFSKNENKDKTWSFSHPDFLRDDPGRMVEIKRKTRRKADGPQAGHRATTTTSSSSSSSDGGNGNVGKRHKTDHFPSNFEDEAGYGHNDAHDEYQGRNHTLSQRIKIPASMALSSPTSSENSTEDTEDTEEKRGDEERGTNEQRRFPKRTRRTKKQRHSSKNCEYGPDYDDQSHESEKGKKEGEEEGEEYEDDVDFGAKKAESIKKLRRELQDTRKEVNSMKQEMNVMRQELQELQQLKNNQHPFYQGNAPSLRSSSSSASRTSAASAPVAYSYPYSYPPSALPTSLSNNSFLPPQAARQISSENEQVVSALNRLRSPENNIRCELPAQYKQVQQPPLPPPPPPQQQQQQQHRQQRQPLPPALQSRTYPSSPGYLNDTKTNSSSADVNYRALNKTQASCSATSSASAGPGINEGADSGADSGANSGANAGTNSGSGANAGANAGSGATADATRQYTSTHFDSPSPAKPKPLSRSSSIDSYTFMSALEELLTFDDDGVKHGSFNEQLLNELEVGIDWSSPDYNVSQNRNGCDQPQFQSTDATVNKKQNDAMIDNSSSTTTSSPSTFIGASNESGGSSTPVSTSAGTPADTTSMTLMSNSNASNTDNSGDLTRAYSDSGPLDPGYISKCNNLFSAPVIKLPAGIDMSMLKKAFCVIVRMKIRAKKEMSCPALEKMLKKMPDPETVLQCNGEDCAVQKEVLPELRKVLPYADDDTLRLALRCCYQQFYALRVRYGNASCVVEDPGCCQDSIAANRPDLNASTD